MAKKPDDNSYDAAALTILKGLDGVRKRPGMYIGATDNRGLHHLVWEIVDNSVDEAIAGHATKVRLTLHKDGSVEVQDNGRGIPVDIHPGEGVPGVVLVLTELHAGGKFGGSGYSNSGGLHGVGASVVNALSTRLDATIRHGGKIHEISFKQGKPGHFDAKGGFSASTKLKVSGKLSTGDTGTTIRYWVDRDVFMPEASLDAELISERLRRTSFLCPGLEITFMDERGEAATEAVYFSDKGISDFVTYLSVTDLLCDVIAFDGSGEYEEQVKVETSSGSWEFQTLQRKMNVNIALAWENGYDSNNLQSYTNNIVNKGGTHVNGFERAVVKVINKLARDTKALKDKDENLIKDDVLEGLVAVVSVQIPEPQFTAQTKDELSTPAATGIVNKIVIEALEEHFASPKRAKQLKAILNKVVNAQKGRLAARRERDTVRRKNALDNSALPAKLADCSSSDYERTELFIVEGDSAAGPVKKARNSKYQAVMPLRGKILNAERASTAKLLHNEEVAALITAMGAGFGSNFDISQARYQRIVLLADADVDGGHITCLMLTLIMRLMRPMMEQGRVFVAMPPLFKITVSGTGERRYAYDDDGRDRILAELAAEGKRPRTDGGVQRNKGLGEMDDEELGETTLHPATRSLKCITIQDMEAAEGIFDLLMGKEVPARKDFIMARATEIDREDLDV